MGLFCNNALDYPFWQVLRYAAPVIVGQCDSFKACTQRYWLCKSYRKCVLEAGFQEGVFNKLQ
jgi:hypothetical protein